jgi:hypothetical protein
MCRAWLNFHYLLQHWLHDFSELCAFAAVAVAVPENQKVTECIKF